MLIMDQDQASQPASSTETPTTMAQAQHQADPTGWVYANADVLFGSAASEFEIVKLGRSLEWFAASGLRDRASERIPLCRSL